MNQVCHSILCRRFWALIPRETPPDVLGAQVMQATDEMTRLMAANGYRRAGAVEIQELACGFLIGFHGEPMGWSN